MEGIAVGQNVEVEADVVKMQLGAFEQLLTDVDEHFGPIQRAQQSQGARTWTEIGTAAAFGSRYSGALSEVETALRSIRADIATAMETLRTNATDLQNRDEENRDRFAALAKRLSDGAPAPAISFQSLVSTAYSGPAPEMAAAPVEAASPLHAAAPDVAASTGSGTDNYK
jgi:multidrug resistance efflux pump